MRKPTLFAFADFLASLVALLMVIVAASMPKVEAKATDDSPAQLVAYISWPPGGDDIDLWTEGPEDTRPVGYSNKGNVTFNLLRDDLGTPDQESNWEIATTRGVPAGAYVFNVHGYRVFGIIHVKMKVAIKDSPTASARTLWSGEADIGAGEERTMVRFLLDDKGAIVPGSVNRIPKALRSAS